MQLDFYLEKAKQRLGTDSDRQLAKSLNVSNVTVCAWRKRHQWPSDERMLAIAEMADISPDQALIELNIWRTASPGARRYYESLLKRIAAILIIAAGAYSLLPCDLASAGTFSEQITQNANPFIYYTIIRQCRCCC